MLEKCVDCSKYIISFALVMLVMALLNSASAQDSCAIKAPISVIITVDSTGSSSLHAVAQHRIPILGSVMVVRGGDPEDSVSISEYIAMISPSGPCQIGTEENSALSPGDWIMFWGDCVVYAWMVPQDFVLIPGNMLFVPFSYALKGDWE